MLRNRIRQINNRGKVMLLKTCIMASVFAFVAASGAKADCANTNSPFDDVYCDIQVFHQADHQLNDDYGALKKLLNPAQQPSPATQPEARRSRLDRGPQFAMHAIG
jgi:uncharacterized protein YecT (DUF1311 family)